MIMLIVFRWLLRP